MKKTLLIGLVLLFVVAAAHAADPTVNKILIPLNYNGPGAYGTHWKTFVEINNRTSRDLTTRTLLDPCPPGVSCGSPYLSAGNTGRLVSDAPHGIIFAWVLGPSDSGRISARIVNRSTAAATNHAVPRICASLLSVIDGCVAARRR